MKKICVITMAREDEFFLRRWARYYSGVLGPENVYVYLDGLDQDLPMLGEGVNIIPVERIVSNSVAEGDSLRIAFLSDRAAELFSRYDIVIGTDCDEMLIPDPARGKNLLEFLQDCESPCLSAQGVDVGQIIGVEESLDILLPLLSQRSRGRLSSTYTKACVLTEPLRWGSGFHRVKGHGYHIAEGLFLFHFGYCDAGLSTTRAYDRTSVGGWAAHIEKRSIIRKQCTEGPVLEWDAAVRKARRIESAVHPVYAWNKPALLGKVMIVEIPQRFREIV